MFLSIAPLLMLMLSFGVTSVKAGLRDHRQFQYNSLVDQGGNYNFAYDTGSRDAHTMHMEHRDSNGVVRGRYGYTDPRGKLRIVEYEAGPDGYKARGDVGPDLFPHMEAPGLAPPTSRETLTPLQLTGWDSIKNPIGNTVWETRAAPEDQSQATYSDYTMRRKRPRPPVYSRRLEPYTSNVYDAPLKYYVRQGRSLRPLTYDENTPLTIYNIDVNPDDIRMAAPSAS